MTQRECQCPEAFSQAVSDNRNVAIYAAPLIVLAMTHGLDSADPGWAPCDEGFSCDHSPAVGFPMQVSGSGVVIPFFSRRFMQVNTRSGGPGSRDVQIRKNYFLELKNARKRHEH
jgi:hypothetical protein